MNAKIRALIALFGIAMLAAFIAVGCSNEEPAPSPDADNPADTTVADTTQPDSTGIGTFELVNTIETPEFPAYFVYNDSLLIYASSYIVKILSLESPDNPEEISQFPPDHPYTSMIKGIALSDTVLIVALDYPVRKLVFVNIADPYSPEQISELPLDNIPQSICASKYYVFVAYGAYSNGDIINYSDREHPCAIGEVPCGFEVADYFNYHLYCTGTNGYVYDVDLNDISSPQIVQTANTGKQNLDISITPWGHLYIACGVRAGSNTGGFIAYDSDQIGFEQYSEDIPGYAAKDVDYQDNFVYLLLRPAPGGTEYLLRVYFSYHLDQTTQAFERTLTYGNCVAATNHYVYVGAMSTTSGGGVIYVFHHQY